jgi:hypothetical protein
VLENAKVTDASGRAVDLQELQEDPTLPDSMLSDVLDAEELDDALDDERDVPE